ncbi:hypothetical protein MLD38_034690 [Melastoma candidum]|uniref:Uncharacterized protein n=1 Tax=Melastoma candidum TaxID=119954 RepID=A0ACB9MBD3_9MYRT|nr:hypothetical protein MLD38_034690 [Melastoma candidum]
MAESICRALRDGALEGEHAPALSIKDSIVSPFGSDVFHHFLVQLSSSILSGKSQSRGIVLVAYSRSPSFYVELLRGKGLDVHSSVNWIRILDCFSDPLGWKIRLTGPGSREDSDVAILYNDVKDSGRLLMSIVKLGKGLMQDTKGCFSVAFDSLSEMVRHASAQPVAHMISSLRSNGEISSAFWMLHTDVVEEKVASIFDYLSSMVALVEPLIPSSQGPRLTLDNLAGTDENMRKARFLARLKRRNGRVRLLQEELRLDCSGLTFASLGDNVPITGGGLVPKVQFNLQLSEKEQVDRANVVLPFEHQGNGKPIEIYDGRQSLTDRKLEVALIREEMTQTSELTTGEILYIRDSDDEMPDSDEDPDDDLDI